MREPLEIRRTTVDARLPGNRRAAIDASAEPGSVIEVVDEAGLVSYRRADDHRGLRSLAPALDGARSVSVLDVSLSEVLQAKMLELAPRKVAAQGVALLTRLYLIPALDALRSPDDDVLQPFGSAAAGPKTLLLHGTFSSPAGSFAGLMDSLSGASARAYAHRTLQKSPVENALELARRLLEDEWATGSVVLLSHSRGGLIGDLLARGALALADRERAYRAAGKGEEAERTVTTLRDLDAALTMLGKKLAIERYVRVAAPAAGTSLATERLPRALEALLNAIGWVLKTLPQGVERTALEAVLGFVKLVVISVVKYGLDHEAAPGLSAMHLESPLVRVLAATPPIEVETYAVGAQLRGAWAASWKKIFWKGASSAMRWIFQEDHDMVVNSASMRRGVPRAQGKLVDHVLEHDSTWHLNYFTSEATRDAIAGLLLGRGSLAPATRTITRATEPELTVGGAAGPRRAIVLFADGAALRYRCGGEEVWPDVGGLLRSSPDQVLTPGERVAGGPYAALEQRFAIRNPEDDPSDAVVVAHGTGIATFLALPEGHPARSRPQVFVGSLHDLSERRDRLRDTLARLISEEQAARVAEAVVPKAADVRVPSPPPSRSLWILGADAPAAPNRWRISGVASAWLGASDELADVVAAFADGETPPLEPATARAASDVPWWTPPESLPDAADLVAAALGRSERAEEGPRAISLQVVHGGAHATSRHALLVLLHFDGDDLAEDAYALEEHWGDDAVFTQRKIRDLLPRAGAVRLVEAAGRRIAHVGVRNAHDARASDVRAAVRAAVLEADAAGWVAPVVAVPVLGASAFDPLRIDASVEASFDGVIDARAELLHLQRPPPERLELFARYEDVAVHAGHVCLGIATSRKRDGARVERLCTRAGYYGKRPVRALERAVWRRWRVSCEADALVFEVDDGRSVRRVERKTRPEPPRAGDDVSAFVVGPEILPGQLRAPELLDDDLLLELDGQSAAYPWELIHAPGHRPLALGRGFIRQLVGVPRVNGVPQVSSRRALVIGDPVGTGVQPLPGAAAEARAVQRLLTGAGLDVEAHIHGGGSRNLELLLAGKSAIVHIAAHGYAADGGGVLVGDGKRLTVSLVETLPATPSLVFLNCCEAGSLAGAGARPLSQLAGAFMARGTRAFVGAAWPIGDLAAAHFAEVFYQQMLGGVPFGRAVQRARAETAARYDAESSWAAYQCYGDPELTLRVRSGTGVPRYVIDREALDETVTLLGEIQSTSAKVRGARERLRQRLLEIVGAAEEAAARGEWGMAGAVQERLGMALADLDMEELALQAWKSALTEKSARADCFESCFDLQARLGFRARDSEFVAKAVASLEALSKIRSTDEVLRRLAQAQARLAALQGDDKRKRKHARAAFSTYERAYDAALGGARLRIAAEWALLAGHRNSRPLDGITHGEAVSARHRLPEALRDLAKTKLTRARLDGEAAKLNAALGDRVSMLARRTTIDLLLLVAKLRREPLYESLAERLEPG